LVDAEELGDLVEARFAVGVEADRDRIGRGVRTERRAAGCDDALPQDVGLGRGLVFGVELLEGEHGRRERVAAEDPHHRRPCPDNPVLAILVDVLAALRRAGTPYERAPGEIALHTMVTTGSVTKRVDRLEQAGLVQRRRSDADGRGRVVRLTPAGRRMIDKVFAAHMASQRRLLDALSPAEAAHLETLLTSWLARLEPPPG
jgi:DNA-binding MarR family transcriptional regulator